MSPIKVIILSDHIYGNKQLGGVHKLRLQDEVGRWSKNVHFLSMFIP